MSTGEQRTILVVDDEYASLEVLVLLLEEEEYRVRSAKDGEEALFVMRSDTIDLVVTDYMMPTLNGLQLCQRMREDEAFRSIPVVMMSAALRGDLPLDPPLVAFVPKPFLFNNLLAVIRKALRAV